MAQAKRIMVSLPDSLLQEVDRIVRLETGNRSAFVREAMVLLLKERRYRELVEGSRNGYRQMGKLNLSLAEEGLEEDSRTLERYENDLAQKEQEA